MIKNIDMSTINNFDILKLKSILDRLSFKEINELPNAFDRKQALEEYQEVVLKIVDLLEKEIAKDSKNCQNYELNGELLDLYLICLDKAEALCNDHTHTNVGDSKLYYQIMLKLLHYKFYSRDEKTLKYVEHCLDQPHEECFNLIAKIIFDELNSKLYYDIINIIDKSKSPNRLVIANEFFDCTSAEKYNIDVPISVSSKKIKQAKRLCRETLKINR